MIQYGHAIGWHVDEGYDGAGVHGEKGPSAIHVTLANLYTVAITTTDTTLSHSSKSVHVDHTVIRSISGKATYKLALSNTVKYDRDDDGGRASSHEPEPTVNCHFFTRHTADG